MWRPSAKMMPPSHAWLEFDVAVVQDYSTVRQTATFDRVGLSGLVYLYVLYRFHQLDLRGYAQGIGPRHGKGTRT